MAVGLVGAVICRQRSKRLWRGGLEHRRPIVKRKVSGSQVPAGTRLNFTCWVGNITLLVPLDEALPDWGTTVQAEGYCGAAGEMETAKLQHRCVVVVRGPQCSGASPPETSSATDQLAGDTWGRA